MRHCDFPNGPIDPVIDPGNNSTDPIVIPTNNSTDPVIEPVNNSGTATTYRLCKNNVCSLGGNGEVLTLTNYDNAKNPTYDQLIAFAKQDHTEELDYNSNFVCSDFARTFHNNCEKAGIKAGWVGVKSINHAFNVFETTDKGTVYIDCTGDTNGGSDVDKQVFMENGKVITSKYLFKNYGTINYGKAPSGITLYW
jgi:hypothetical protein